MPDHTAVRRAVERIGPVSVLALLAGAYFAAQLLLTNPARFFGWDEAIYLAEAFPDVPSIEWGPHRARGIVYLVAPVGLLASLGEPVRVYMAAATSLLLFLAYAAWRPTIGWGAVWAAAVFAFSWIGLAQGTDVLPNLPAALCAVGLTGAFLARVMAARTPMNTVGVVGFGSALALLRPTESAPLAVVLVVSATWWVLRAAEGPQLVRARLLPDAALLAGGLALGWMHWVFEAVQLFGGPVQRLVAAAETLPGPPDAPLSLLWAYAGMIDGPLHHAGTDGLPVMAIVWSTFLLGGCVLAMSAGGRAERTIGGTVLTASVGLLSWYLAYDWIEVRFLAPAWALASVAVGLGYAELRSNLPSRRSARAAAIAVVLAALVLVPWHARIARDVGTYQAQVAESHRAVADAMRSLAGEGECVFYADDAARQLELASGCDGTPISTVSRDPPAGLPAQRASGASVFVAVRQRRPPSSFLDGWHDRTIRAAHGPDWTVYFLPRSGSRS